MINRTGPNNKLDLETLRAAVHKEYETVAINPQQGFHFHTGCHLAQILGYKSEWLEGIAESAIESFAGGLRGLWRKYKDQRDGWSLV